MSLAEKKRVLVTRPQAQAEGLVEALSASGFEPVPLPLLEILPIDNQDIARRASISSLVTRLDEFQHCIFISTNAVHLGWQWIDQFWPQRPAGQVWYGIGEATCQALSTHVDCLTSTGPAMNSEALLSLQALQSVEGQKVIIFRGQDGRDILRQTLEERGAAVSYCEVYQRRAISYRDAELANILLQGLDFLTVTSAETIHILLEQAIIDGVRDALVQIPLIAPGKRLADIASESGFNKVIMAANAGITAMLDALVEQ